MPIQSAIQPPKLFPTSVFGLIPDQFVFTPTLENYTGVFSRAMISGAAAESTGFDRYFFNSIVIASVSVSAMPARDASRRRKIVVFGA